MDNIKLLKAYLDRLSADTGWDIMIDDRFFLFDQKEELRPYYASVKWHCNPYCLTVKKSNRIHNICINTKPLRSKKLARASGPCWTVCHCGVAEYSVPIFVNNVLIAVIFVTGFMGKLSENMQRIISKKIKMPEENLKKIRNMSLLNCDEECQNRLDCYLPVAAEMMKNIALQSPLIHNAYKPNSIAESHLYVLKAVEYIEDNFCNRITINDIAKHCHISSSYLQHLFLKYYGEGLSAFLRKKRMERACELLANSNRSIRDIAISCGFYDTDYFSVAFKKMFNISPLTYRKKNNNYK